MGLGLIFDLDQTIIDTSIAEPYRKARNWNSVYSVINRFEPYPGIIEALNKFQKQGFKICIVTSSPSSYCSRVLNHWKIPADFSICYHDTVNKKPHPEPIIKGISLLDKPKNKILSFGDRDIDIIASNRSEVASVACLWGADDLNSIINSKPRFTVRNSIELLNLVEAYSLIN